MIRSILRTSLISTALTSLGISTVRPVNYSEYTFAGATSIPSPFQYFRSDTVATYRNSSGNLVVAGTNEARFDYDSSGVAKGVLMEPSRTNKCTAYNLNPTALTNLTAGGNASASISIVSDSSALTTGKINAGNGNVIEVDNTLGGSGTAYVDVSGTTANTNPHSFSCYARVVSGASGSMSDNGGSGSVNFTNTTYERILSENFTPSSASATFRITAPLGSKVRFILFQSEEAVYATTPIIVAGASATRAHNRIVATDITQIPFWSASQGTLVAEIESYIDGGMTVTSSDNYMLLAANGTSATDCFAIYAIPTRMKARPRVASANTNYSVGDISGGFVKNKKYPIGISYTNGGAVKTFAGAGVFENWTMSASATGLTRFYLGGRDTGNAMSGWVRKLRVYNEAKDLSSSLSGFLGSSDVGIVFSGQSNSVGYFSQQSGSRNGGERTGQTILDSVIGSSTRNWMINGGTSGTSTTDWTGTGTAITRWKEIVSAFKQNGGVIKAIVWDQGEANAADSLSTVKSAWLSIFTEMRSYIGSDVPVIIIPMGRRSDTDVDWNNLRRAQRELDEEYSWIYLAPEKWTQPLDDVVHLTDAGYQAQIPHVLRKALKVSGYNVSGGVDGPSITGWSRSGTTVTVTIAHDAGTDISPSSGIQGFTFLDNATPITINSAVRTNATTITLTLNSAPSSGIETLYYGYKSLLGVTTSNLVVDNEATYPKPLKFYYGTN